MKIKRYVSQKCLAEAPEDSHFLYVGVGDRAFWKDQNNIFRTAKETQLRRLVLEGYYSPKIFDIVIIFSVPTLIKWGTKQRLEEGQLMNENLIKMMLED